jgi:hypothetical protein
MNVNEIKMMIDTIYPFGLINLKTQRRQHLELIEYMLIKLIITKMRVKPVFGVPTLPSG